MNVLVVNHSGRLNRYVAHRHDCWEIVIVTEGRVVVESDFGKNTFAPDAVYILPPLLWSI